MKFHDPQRPHLTAGVPCWLTAPHIALPRINIKPWPLDRKDLIEVPQGTPIFSLQSTPRYSLEVIINGSQKIIVLSLDSILEVLSLWAEDPEHALNYWWHTDPPTGVKPQDSTPNSSTQIANNSASLEDL